MHGKTQRVASPRKRACKTQGLLHGLLYNSMRQVTLHTWAFENFTDAVI